MRRNILHESRNIWYHAHLMADRCHHENLRRLIRSLMSTEGKIVMLDQQSGSSQSQELSLTDYEITASAFAPYFEGLEDVPQKKMHFAIETELAKNCRNCPATELPLMHSIFSGFIDVVLDYPDRIEIWDYKPGTKDTNALGQVSFYAAVLSNMIDEPIENFRVGWFDEHDMVSGVPAFDYNDLRRRAI